MKRLKNWFIPHSANRHRPHFLRHPSLALFIALLLTAETTLNLFYSTEPKILGFATSIYQQEIIQLTNQRRQKEGLAPLVHNPILDEAAQLKAADMFAKNYWAHISPDGTTPWHWFKLVGYDYYMAGENLARDFNTSAGVVNAWMASPSHRENILQKDFREIGIAVANGILDGEETTLVVQFFGLPSESTSLAMTLTEEAVEPLPTATLYPTPVATATVQTYPESVVARLNAPPTFRPLGLPAANAAQTQFVAAVQPSSWGLGQRMMLASLGLLMLLFLVDSVVLWRKRILRRNSHSLLHAGVLGLLILAVLWSTIGVVL